MPSSALEETVSILNGVTGGAEAVAWFHGRPTFGDAEVLELRLSRRGGSVLRLAAMISRAGAQAGPPFKHAIFEFAMSDMIDVRLEGFGPQNVIGGLTLWRNQDRAVHPSLIGIGLAPGAAEIEFTPCAGAFGSIRCTIESIRIIPVDDYQQSGA
jgi:hypothetical protein